MEWKAGFFSCSMSMVYLDLCRGRDFTLGWSVIPLPWCNRSKMLKMQGKIVECPTKNDMSYWLSRLHPKGPHLNSTNCQRGITIQIWKTQEAVVFQCHSESKNIKKYILSWNQWIWQDLFVGTKLGTWPNHLSNEKNPGWLGYIGDEILPSYIGIITNHYSDPYNQPVFHGK